MAAVMKYFSQKMAKVNGCLIPVSQAVPTRCREFLCERESGEHNHHQDVDDDVDDDDDADGARYDDDGAGYEHRRYELMDEIDVRNCRLFDVMNVTAAGANALKSIPELFEFAMAYWYGFISAYHHTPFWCI